MNHLIDNTMTKTTTSPSEPLQAAGIRQDPRNYRLHGEKNKELIKKSLDECGAGRSILIDAEDVIIAGNGVFEQAQALGLKVRVVESDGTELIAVKRTDLCTADERRKVLALADNQTSDTSVFDLGALPDDFSTEELVSWGFDTALFGGDTIDDLAENAFMNTVKGAADSFSVTLLFPIEQKDTVEGYIKAHGKTELVTLILDHLCHAAEAK